MTGNNTRDGNPASFTITRRENIIEKLAHIEKLSVLIDVKPTAVEGDAVITTHISKILPDKNLFAIDVSADAELNLALKNGGELVFSATINGVAARFKTPGLTPATLGGKPVFAVSIPESLYWRERRRSYRMPIPPAEPIICTLLLPGGLHIDKFQVLDISLTGFSVLDENQLVAGKLAIGHVLQGCQFSLPVARRTPFNPKDPFNAKLCRTEVVGSNGKLRSFKLGFRFEKMTPAFEKGIRDLLQVLAQNRKK